MGTSKFAEDVNQKRLKIQTQLLEMEAKLKKDLAEMEENNE